VTLRREPSPGKAGGSCGKFPFLSNRERLHAGRGEKLYPSTVNVTLVKGSRPGGKSFYDENFIEQDGGPNLGSTPETGVKWTSYEQGGAPSLIWRGIEVPQGTQGIYCGRSGGVDLCQEGRETIAPRRGGVLRQREGGGLIGGRRGWPLGGSVNETFPSRSEKRRRGGKDDPFPQKKKGDARGGGGKGKWK